VSDSESVSALKPSPRGFVHALLFGGMIAAAAWMTQNPVNHFSRAVAQRPMLIRLIDATRTQAPSAYEEESVMGPPQLLNRWDAVIAEASQRFHVPRAWIRAVMARESGGRTMLGEGQPIVSPAGAVGLMQVLPGTYVEMAEQYRLGADPFDAHDNIMAGAAYLRWLHQKYGYPAMFAAYNAGPGRLEQHLVHGVKLPAETQAYVGNITHNLGLRMARAETVKLTRPDGVTLKIDAGKVTAIRPVLPGEYAAGVKSVLILGAHKRQAIQEDVQVATAAIRATGGLI
jgi:Transglycosylase SLT domain